MIPNGIRLVWSGNPDPAVEMPLGNGVANIVWSDAYPLLYGVIDTAFSDQVVLLVYVDPGGVRNAVVQLSFQGIVYGPAPGGIPRSVEQCMATGALAAPEQRFTLYDMAWGPLAPRTLAYTIERPIAVSNISVGVYLDGAVAITDRVSIGVLRHTG
jgi:hypothetical protein